MRDKEKEEDLKELEHESINKEGVSETKEEVVEEEDSKIEQEGEEETSLAKGIENMGKVLKGVEDIKNDKFIELPNIRIFPKENKSMESLKKTLDNIAQPYVKTVGNITQPYAQTLEKVSKAAEPHIKIQKEVSDILGPQYKELIRIAEEIKTIEDKLNKSFEDGTGVFENIGEGLYVDYSYLYDDMHTLPEDYAKRPVDVHLIIEVNNDEGKDDVEDE